jgi:hypothetical protein
MLNSFWGKFGQRSNMPQIKYISEPAEYFDMLTSDQILVMGIHFVSDEMVEMRYHHHHPSRAVAPTAAAAAAASTTTVIALKFHPKHEKRKQKR